MKSHPITISFSLIFSFSINITLQYSQCPVMKFQTLTILLSDVVIIIESSKSAKIVIAHGETLCKSGLF